MIRVLHILHSMNRGGAEVMLMNYYRNIDRAWVQFDFLLTESTRCLFEDEIEQMGGRVYRVPLLKMGNPMPYINGVRTFFAEHPEYRIVHSHTSSKSALPLWIAKRRGIPIRIAHSHNNKSEGGMSGWMRDFLKIPLKRVATDFFACGRDAAKWLYGEKMWYDGKVKVLANAIPVEQYVYDVQRREDIRSKYSISTDTTIMGMVARFNGQKNHLFALELLKKLKESNVDAKLLLVGDGELKTTILQRIEELGIEDDVILAGVVSDVPNYLQAMDVVLMPSYNEGLPVSLVEAQANGLSVVASTWVPHEVDVTSNVEFLPLEVNEWANVLATKISQGVKRDVMAADKVRAAGYDIKTASKWLQEWYVKTEQLLHDI